MLITLLPLVTVHATTPPEEVSSSPRAAQVHLAQTLADADSIDAVAAHGQIVSFSITRDGTAFRVEATTRKRGEVVSLAVTEDPLAQSFALGGLSWLSDELDDSSTLAVTRLSVDEDGAVTIATNLGSKYIAIPGRGSGGNTAVEARWAAEWDGE